MNLIQASTPEQLHQIHALYQKAFPACERKPFSLICEKQAAGLVDLLYLEEQGSFCGLAITMNAEDLILLDYFAIADSKRGMGYGSAALQALFTAYRGKRFFLEIESTGVEAPNLPQRIQRKQFYLKNQMRELNIHANVFGTEMELLSHNALLSFQEYHNVYRIVYGAQKAANIQPLP